MHLKKKALWEKGQKMMEATEINGKLSSIIKNGSSKGQRSGYLGNLARIRVTDDDGKEKKKQVQELKEPEGTRP